MELNLEIVAHGLGFPEGPVALQDGTLIFVDIQKQGLFRLSATGQVELVANIPGGPNGVAIGPDGFAYVCNNGGIFDFVEMPLVPKGTGRRTRDEYLLLPDAACPGGMYRGGSISKVNLKTGHVTEIYGPNTGHQLIAPDDIVFDSKRPEGAFWFTDCGYQNEGVLMKGGVYRATIDGKSLAKVARVPSANGIGLSPEGDVLYVADTLFARLWAIALDPLTRAVIPPYPDAPFDGEVILTLQGLQWLDSLKVEQSGRICIATLLSGGITIFDKTDKSVDFLPVGVPLPNGLSKGDPMTSNLCFGGPNLDDVWITSSAEGRIYHGKTWPRPGLKLAFNA